MLGVLLTPTLSHAYEGAVSSGILVDHLSKDKSGWSTLWAAYDRQMGAHTVVLHSARHDRGGLKGHELTFSHYIQGVAPTLDLSYQLDAGDGAAWAKTGVGAALHLRAGEGWVFSSGARYREFEQDIAKTVFAEVEKYFGNNRLAYRLSHDVSAGAKNLFGHQVTLSHYFEDGADVTMTAAAGKELNRDLGRTLPESEVLALSVRGAVPLSKTVALLPSLSWTKQDQAYERLTAGLALRVKF